MTSSDPSEAPSRLEDKGFQALQELTEVLAQPGGAEVLCSRALEALHAVLDLSASAILLADAAGTLRFQAGSGLDAQGAEAFCARSTCLPDTEPLLLDDLDQSPRFGACLEIGGIRSLVVLPLRNGGRLLGQCLLGSGLPRRFTPGELRFASSVANLVGCHASPSRQDQPTASAEARSDLAEIRRGADAGGASEEIFSRIFHASPDAIDLTRLEDGVSLDCNQSYLNTYGYLWEEVHGHSTLPGDLGLWVRQEDRDRHVSELQKLGRVSNFETPLRRKDGSTFIGLISSSLVEIQGLACNLSLTRDITEQKRMEEALRESARRLRLALASGNLGIWDRNLLDDTEIWDQRMFEIYGLVPEDIRPDYTNWLEKIVHPEDVPRVAATIRAALAGERPYAIQFRIRRPDGAVRHVASNAIVIRDAAGKAVRVIGINRDRTEQEEAEAERQRLQAEVHHTEKLESLGSLAGGVAHDMNNVLTAILVMAEILRNRHQDDASAARSLDTILHAGQRGRDLVKALTDFARKGLETISSLDLNELLRQEVELLRRTTLQKVRVVLDLDEGLPEVQGAASDLGSALMNLSVNALDAMPEGGTLTFRSRSLGNGWVELAVVDSGQGMAPEVLAKAMEPFFTTKPKGKGTGLGLSRVYGTVKAHGGSVELRSRPGQGTTVVLRLPVRTGAATPGSAEAAQEKTPQALRILLVDDEEIILDTIPPALEALGHAVEATASGAAALSRLETRDGFDVVILDQNMPGLTGLQTIRRLRTSCPDLPVILSTGFLDPGAEAALNDIPAVWILRKPYNTQELQRLLSGLAQVMEPRTPRMNAKQDKDPFATMALLANPRASAGPLSGELPRNK